MAYLALYRLYRPKTFEEVVGQEHITHTLKNQVEMGRIGHAYLFSGARGTGKTSTAKVFARAINCLTPHGGEPCGTCDICKMSDEDLSVDIVEIDAASNNGVDEIRDLRDKIRFAPTLCKYKVYIIDEVHMLSTGAFNALLKTLEEPPAHAVFILATTEMQKLPATILSRCQRYEFRRISETDIEKQLASVLQKQEMEYDERAIQAIAQAAEGGMRDALSILDQCLSFETGKLEYDSVGQILGAAGSETVKRMSAGIISGNIVSCMDIIGKTYDAGVDMGVFARELIEVFRREMMGNAAQGKAGFVLRAVSELSAAESSMRYAQRPRIALEAAVVRLCIAPEEQDVSALIQRIERLEATVGELKENGIVRHDSAESPMNKDVAQKETEADTGEGHDALSELRTNDITSMDIEEDDSPPWDMQEAVEVNEPEEKAEAETGNVQEIVDEQEDSNPPEGETEPKEMPEQTQAAPSGLTAKQLYDAIMQGLRLDNKAKMILSCFRFGKPVSLRDDVLLVGYEEDMSLMIETMQTPKYAETVEKLASDSAGRKMKVQYQVGVEAGESVLPEVATEKESKADALDKETGDMLEQVKNTFHMDIEITD